MPSRISRTVIGFLLLPVVLGAGRAFFSQVALIATYRETLHLLERGVLLYLILHVLVFRPVFLYVIGHEFVHVLATWICGGRVLSFDISRTGGSVVTSKTNFFIELSPYFVPIYTLILGPCYFFLKKSGGSDIFPTEFFIFLVGFTLAFHFIMTVEALKIQQSDVMKSGNFFSLVMILVANLVFIMAVFCPVFDGLSFRVFIKEAFVDSRHLYITIYEKVLEAVRAGVV